MTDRLVAAGLAGSTGSLVLLGLLVLMMVWMITGQRRRARQTQALQDSLRDGDEVVNASGIFGTLRGSAGRRAYVEVAPGVVVEMDRRQIVPVPEHLRKEPADTPVAEADAQGASPQQDHPTQQEH